MFSSLSWGQGRRETSKQGISYQSRGWGEEGQLKVKSKVYWEDTQTGFDLNKRSRVISKLWVQVGITAERGEKHKHPATGRPAVTWASRASFYKPSETPGIRLPSLLILVPLATCNVLWSHANPALINLTTRPLSSSLSAGIGGNDMPLWLSHTLRQSHSHASNEQLLLSVTARAPIILPRPSLEVGSSLRVTDRGRGVVNHTSASQVRNIPWLWGTKYHLSLGQSEYTKPHI